MTNRCCPALALRVPVAVACGIMADGVTLSLNGFDLGPVSPDCVALRLAELASDDRAEVWASQEDGPALCLLKSGARAFLMYLRENGDPGMTSRSEESQKDDPLLSFTLGNGQEDQYPASWTVPYTVGCRAVEYFWSHRAPAPFVHWHDDA